MSLLGIMEQLVSSSEAFYESERPSLPLDIGQLQVSKICLIYKEKILNMEKKEIFKTQDIYEYLVGLTQCMHFPQ